VAIGSLVRIAATWGKPFANVGFFEQKRLRFATQNLFGWRKTDLRDLHLTGQRSTWLQHQPDFESSEGDRDIGLDAGLVGVPGVGGETRRQVRRQYSRPSQAPDSNPFNRLGVVARRSTVEPRSQQRVDYQIPSADPLILGNHPALEIGALEKLVVTLRLRWQ
jgi:hypothetical protein